MQQSTRLRRRSINVAGQMRAGNRVAVDRCAGPVSRAVNGQRKRGPGLPRTIQRAGPAAVRCWRGNASERRARNAAPLSQRVFDTVSALHSAPVPDRASAVMTRAPVGRARYADGDAAVAVRAVRSDDGTVTRMRDAPRACPKQRTTRICQEEPIRTEDHSRRTTTDDGQLPA